MRYFLGAFFGTYILGAAAFFGLAACSTAPRTCELVLDRVTDHFIKVCPGKPCRDMTTGRYVSCPREED